MRQLSLTTLALFALIGATVQALSGDPDLGQEFAFFVDSTNVLVPENEGEVVEDPLFPGSGNLVLQMDYRPWASVALAFNEAEGADMSAMVSEDPGRTETLRLRFRSDPSFADRGPCAEDGSNCLSLVFFDSFSGPQDRESIDSGAGDPAMRLKWFIPDSLRDGAWHSLAIPLPPTTLDALETARTLGQLSGAQAGWHYTGAWAGGYGIGCCGSNEPASEDSLWQEFDWQSVARLGVHFDFNDELGGSVYLDDFYIGDPYMDLSEQGVPAPTQPTNAAPADGAENQSAQLTLHWMGRVGAAHEIQISKTPDFTPPLDRQGTVYGDSLVVSGLKARTYYWRVRASGREMDTPWSTPWSFSVAPVSAPNLISPAHSATGVSIRPDFVWETVAGGISYRVQIASDSLFADLIRDEAGVPFTSISASLLSDLTLAYDTPYFWRVRGESVEGASGWSVPFRFRTMIPTPDAPALLQPEDGEADVSVDVSLIWTEEANADYYEIEMADSQAFGTILTSLTTGETQAGLTGLARGTTYWWRVRSVNQGGPSSWTTRSFVTEIEPPTATTLTQPIDGSTGNWLNPDVSWELVPAATMYRVQVSQSIAFDQPVVDSVHVGGNRISLGMLRPFRVHFWRVRAINRGGVSDWSTVFSFTTADNALPTANDDQASGLEDVPLDLRVTENDVDLDGDTIVLQAVTEPKNGYAFLSGPDIIRYVPFENWSGADSLDYTIHDGRGGTARATIRIDMDAVNDAPPGPEVLLPLPGSPLNVQGMPDRLFTVIWLPVQDIEADTVRYAWEMALNPNFSPSLFWLDVGREESASVTYGDLARALTSSGLYEGDATVAYHRVVATDGMAQTTGATTTLPLIRGLITSAEDHMELPTELGLGAPYPNPTSSQVRLDLSMPEPASVGLSVIDALGRQVTNHQSSPFGAGRHQIVVDASNYAPGAYWVSVRVGDRRLTVPVLVAR